MPIQHDANTIIDVFRLQPLQGEGGYFRQTYSMGNPDAPEATAIYYLITPQSFSSLHRLAFDEVFHFYAGDPCQMIQIDPARSLSEHLLGTDFADGQRPQIVVPGGTWQGTMLVPGGSWALIGTTMTPGFRPDIFELATSRELAALSPEIHARAESFLS